MQYDILYQDAFPVIKCNLSKGESIVAESDAMVAMSGDLEISGTLKGGGFFKGLARKWLTKQSFFMQKIVASKGPGCVMLGHPAPGGILDVDIDGSYGLHIQKNGFLAATDGIQIGTAVQNLSQGMFSKEGFFVLNATGRGTVFISSYGAIHRLDLNEGEELSVDNGHLVAWPDYMEYKIKKAGKGWFKSLASGEGLVCRFKGPGTILIQTRNPASFKNWINNLYNNG